MIFLICECKSGLGEDTFWTWFEREFPNHEFLNNTIIPEKYNETDDIIIIYSTLGELKNPYNKKYKAICLAWELYPEMKLQLCSNEWDNRILLTQQCAKSCTEIVVATEYAIPYYKDCGNVSIMKLGLNTDLFKPLNNKSELRKKYNIPENMKIGYWGGTNHIMKGFDRLVDYANKNSDIFWIIVWKQHSDKGIVPQNINHREFVHLPQNIINELMNCSDFLLCTSRLRPFYMTELEAMSADLPFILTENISKDFIVSENSRNDIFTHGWDRNTIKNNWIELLNKNNIKY
jgi:hypothetical protein